MHADGFFQKITWDGISLRSRVRAQTRETVAGDRKENLSLRVTSTGGVYQASPLQPCVSTLPGPESCIHLTSA